MSLSQARMQEMERSITGVARKVLNAVPTAEPWSTQQIFAETRRLQMNIAMSVSDGCLKSLALSGLIREAQPGRYIRVAARPRLAAVPIEETEQPTDEANVPTPTPTADPIDQLSQLESELRGLATTATQLASRVEEIAVSVDERIKAIRADTEKLSQLKKLLQSI